MQLDQFSPNTGVANMEELTHLHYQPLAGEPAPQAMVALQIVLEGRLSTRKSRVVNFSGNVFL